MGASHGQFSCVAATATVFSIFFAAPLEVVVGMIGIGVTTAILEDRLWLKEHRGR
jgi:hypothetical protein